MDVLQVAWEYPPRLFGGLGRHLEGLVPALVDEGLGVTVLTPALREGDVAVEGGPGLRVLRGPPPAVPLPADRWLAAVLDANATMVETALDHVVTADVVHVHDWMAGHAGRVLAQRFGVPLVVTVHATERGRHGGHLPPGYSGWIDAQERALVDRAAVVITCSSFMAQQVSQSLGSAAVSVIPNGVTPGRWAAAVPRRRDQIVLAARLEHEKGIHVAIEATRDLDVDLVVAGAGSQAKQLRSQAHERVRFVGHLDQAGLAVLLAESAIALVPSLYEPFGLAALEAMAAGTPVIATAVGGLVEVVTPGSGVLVTPDDPAALRSAIAGLLADPAQRRNLADAGRARASVSTWSAAGRAHAAVYAGLLDPSDPEHG